MHVIAADYERASTTTEILGESPVWCPASRRVYWIDVRGPAVLRVDPATGATDRWRMPEIVGGLVLADDSTLVVALASGLHRFDPRTAVLARLLALEPATMRNRLNDTKCDRAGRLWTGSMRDFGLAASGSLYRVARGVAMTVLGDLRIPNGPCWSLDDRTFYFADSALGRIHAYAFDAGTGELGEPRVWVDQGMIPGNPDGATVDAEGFVWSARYGGGGIARIDPDGKVERFVRLPVTQVSSCAFGGADLTTLYVTTSRQRLSDEAIAREPLAGAMLAVDARVKGVAEAPFAG
jgi:sugar lactone lactonase YvrE